MLMFYDEFVVLVVNGNGAEAFHRALSEEKGSTLVVYDRSLDILEFNIANHDFAEGDDCTGAQFTGGHLIVALSLDVFVGKVAVLQHEVGFD